jgi:chaperonin GroEL (HSP60 family)
MSQRIINSGANLVFCEGTVDESVEDSLAKHGILLFQKLKVRDMEMVSKATGASILSIRDDIMPHNLGFADEAKVEKRNNEHFLFLSVSDQLISTIMIWEPFSYGLEKIEEAVDDAVNNAAFILKNPLAVRGGGDLEFVVSQMLRQYSSTIEGKEQLAVIEYANALEEIPRTLARNAGLNEVDTIAKMLSSYNKGIDCRIDLAREVVANNPPVYDSFNIKQMAIIAATEAVSNMLRIDKIVLKKS